MKEIAKVVGINLVILLVITPVNYYGTRGGGYEDLGFVLMMIYWLAFHVGICLITAIVLFIKKRSRFGWAFIIATLVVPMIGTLLLYLGAR